MNIKKITFLILVIVLINIIFIPKTFAFSDIISAGDEFLNSGDPADSVIDETKLSNVSSKIYNILLVCGIGVAVIVGAVLGITFILSSAEGKAKVSETLVPYIVGCVVVFGAFGIWKLAINIGNDTIDNTEVGFKSAEETSDAAWQIIDGKVEMDSFTDLQIRQLYNAQYVGDDLRSWTTSDPRAGGRDKIMTLEQAINNLSEYKRKIYDEAKKRGLLQENGINLIPSE